MGGWGGKGGWGGGGNLASVLQALVGGKGGKGKGRRGPNINKYDAEKKVWVGNLPEDKASWKELNEPFKTAGKVKWVEPLGKRSAGTSVVVMDTAEEAAAAIATLNGSMVGGKAI